MDAISRYTNTTGQSIQGIDEIKLQKSDTGKIKVPSLRYLSKTINVFMTKEEHEANAKLKSIKTLTDFAETLKKRKHFQITLKSDFILFLIIEMANYFV